MIQNLNQADLNNILKSDNIVLFDFYSDCCAPCKVLASILPELEKEFSGLEIYKVNISEHEDFAMKMNIRSSPTVILFKNGEEAVRVLGLRNKDYYFNQIREFING